MKCRPRPDDGSDEMTTPPPLPRYQPYSAPRATWPGALADRAALRMAGLLIRGVDGALSAVHRHDADALDQVLVNLVDNAIKYTGADGKVVVTVQATGQTARVLVSDDGPGIAAQHLPRIFERFYRVDAGRGRGQGGTGLGLAIVKHLVQRMDGRVHAESRVGRGTTFVVELPRASA